jgi:predicted MFS family arabinose efflux permease
MNSYRLLRHRPFRRMLAAHFLSGIGDWFNSVAILSLLLQLTGTSMAVGVTLALRTLPFLLFGPLGGKLADRFSRKRILMICDVARALIALSFLLISSKGDIWIAYAGTFALIAFSAVYQPARAAMIPQIVPKEDVAAANALEQSVLGTVMAIGSLVSGVVTSLWGPGFAFVCNALSFVASALLIMGVPLAHDRTHPPDSSATDAPSPTFRELLPLFRQAPLVPLILAFSLLWPVGGGIANVLISVYAYQEFHAGDAGIGLLYGAIGVGFLVGGLLSDTLQRWPFHMAAVGMTAEGIAHLLISAAPSLYSAAALFCLSTVAGGMGNASLQTLLMQRVPNHYLGRVFALEGTFSGVVIGCSMLAGGWLLTMFPPRTLGWISGLFITLISLAIGLALLRLQRREQKRPTPARGVGVS